MENYFEAKAKLFHDLASQSKKKKASAVINIDDRYGEKLIGRLAGKIPVVTYGLGMHADFRASNYRTEFAGTSYQLDARGRSYLVRVPLIGRFNVANSMAALAAATVMGVSLRERYSLPRPLTPSARTTRARSGKTPIPNLCRLRAY